MARTPFPGKLFYFNYILSVYLTSVFVITATVSGRVSKSSGSWMAPPRAHRLEVKTMLRVSHMSPSHLTKKLSTQL